MVDTVVAVQKVVHTVQVAGAAAVAVVKEQTVQVVTVGTQGPVGGGAGGTYSHSQSIAGAVWTVPHNLNRRPNVTTTDNLDRVIVGDVAYIDSNIVQITHGSALTGFAYFS